MAVPVYTSDELKEHNKLYRMENITQSEYEAQIRDSKFSL